MVYNEGWCQPAGIVRKDETAAGSAARIACFTKVEALIGAMEVPLARLKRRNGYVVESLDSLRNCLVKQTWQLAVAPGPCRPVMGKGANLLRPCSDLRRKESTKPRDMLQG